MYNKNPIKIPTKFLTLKVRNLSLKGSENQGAKSYKHPLKNREREWGFKEKKEERKTHLKAWSCFFFFFVSIP